MANAYLFQEMFCDFIRKSNGLCTNMSIVRDMC